MIKEFSFIARLAERFGSEWPGLIRGIGDDCAHLEPQQGYVQLITTDLGTHGVHFSSRHSSWQDIGWKVLVQNLSDLAASGADPDMPILVFLALAVPNDMLHDDVERFVDGLAECMDRFDVRLAGGDTSSTMDQFSTAITAVGYAKKPVTRSGARPGDLLAVAGNVGMAGAGFELLDAGQKKEEFAPLTKAYCRPKPLLQVGHNLASAGLANAMIDVSDGVVADAGHIAEQSNCDLEIRVDDLPLSPLAVEALGEEKAIRLGATFGDDYALICAVPPDRIDQARDAAAQGGEQLYVLGRFTEGKGSITMTRAGQPFRLGKTGYQHTVGRK